MTQADPKRDHHYDDDVAVPLLKGKETGFLGVSPNAVDISAGNAQESKAINKQREK